MDEQGKFSVFTSSYVNTAINQSAFRILKCYIIIQISKHTKMEIGYVYFSFVANPSLQTINLAVFKGLPYRRKIFSIVHGHVYFGQNAQTNAPC